MRDVVFFDHSDKRIRGLVGEFLGVIQGGFLNKFFKCVWRQPPKCRLISTSLTTKVVAFNEKAAILLSLYPR